MPPSHPSTSQFQLPPAFNFEAARRQQRAALNSRSGSNRNSQAGSPDIPHHHVPSSNDALSDALKQFVESNNQLMANQAGVGSHSSNSHDGMNAMSHAQQHQHHHQPQQQQQQQPFVPDNGAMQYQHHQLNGPGIQAGPQTAMRHNHHPTQIQQQHRHQQQQYQHTPGPSSTPAGPSHLSSSSSSTPNGTHDPEYHARLISSASDSFNHFAMDLSRSRTAALNLGYVDPALTKVFSDIQNAAQTLCTELGSISASLKTLNAPSRPALHHTNSNPLTAGLPPDLAALYAQLQRDQQAGGSSSSVNSPHPLTPGGVNQMHQSPAPASAAAAAPVDSGLFMSILNGQDFPPGPGEQMMDFLAPTASSSGPPRASSSTEPLQAASAAKKRKEQTDDDADIEDGEPASPKKHPKHLIKHKSRPPIQGVRRDSVRYRNRKLLVDMREQLYKWLDTTEFCRIAKSYPSGQNGWIELSVDVDNPSAGTRRVFKPNFEIGSDLYIANKDLLEELIELGVRKVTDKPEAYGMKEGVAAKDVVVDVAKDLMDSARHGYRANLKKAHEDEVDAKAKSTRYKQQERHRTKVRNREVGAKRLKHPIPDSLLTMGLHSDDAASDQEEMHGMVKEDWQKLRMKKLLSNRGWEALSGTWRSRHLTKAYHIADVLSKSKQMPRFRREGGIDMEVPTRLWGKTLPSCVFDPAWLEANRAKIKGDPYNITVHNRVVEGWKEEEHRLSDDTESELERYERDQIRLNRANRKKIAGNGSMSGGGGASSSGTQQRSVSASRQDGSPSQEPDYTADSRADRSNTSMMSTSGY
jgi:hypothetical protein